MCHWDGAPKARASHSLPGSQAAPMAGPRAGAPVWALGSHFINFIEIVLVLNADAWRMEGQSSPRYLANGFWARLIAAALATTSLRYNLI